jgi:tetratricopeptide (TPR) repeat protein
MITDWRNLMRVSALGYLLFSLVSLGCETQFSVAEESSVFRRPVLAEQSQELQLRGVHLARLGQVPSAVQTLQEAVRIAPFSALARYNLACMYAKSGQPDESLATLKRAVELGFRDTSIISKDPDLDSLRERPEFLEIADEAKKPFEPSTLKPSQFENGIAWVGPENTVWEELTNMLRTRFEWKQPEKPRSIILEHGEVGNRLRKWFSEGTAAGNFGDLYDNCDRDHSNLKYLQFPQLHRIEYRPEILADAPQGLQNRLLHGGVVIGNSSTSLVNSPIWRSNPRMAYLIPSSMTALTRQYFHNHLYVYPEHHDHDPGRDGSETEGNGDVYPANTPYLLISQGSSYTDQPFLDALACTLAAFRPTVKKRLAETGLIAPSLQQIFRTTYKLVKKPEDYFTGIAHPSVFDGSQIDSLKMVEAAHAMTDETIPPVARIRVEQQDRSIVGRDYFDVMDREQMFDTPCSIARIGRSLKYRRQMIVTARESFDLNQTPLKFRWVVLRGDESLISIKPLDEAGSRADITVAWHPRRKIHPNSPMESNRVDIGVFAYNGTVWSAPSFITWFFLDNEDREYDDQGRILSVAYHGGEDKSHYVDPLIQTPKTWKDDYHYADDGRLIGWTRTRDRGADQKIEKFTADGYLVIEEDADGRAVAAQSVHYVLQAEEKSLPKLLQQLGGEILGVSYVDSNDKIGKVISREKVDTRKNDRVISTTKP